MADGQLGRPSEEEGPLVRVGVGRQRAPHHQRQRVRAHRDADPRRHVGDQHRHVAVAEPLGDPERFGAERVLAADLLGLPGAGVEGQDLVEDLVAQAEELEGGGAQHPRRQQVMEGRIRGSGSDTRRAPLSVHPLEDDLVGDAHRDGGRGDGATGVRDAAPLVHLGQPLPSERIGGVLLEAPMEVGDRPAQVHRLRLGRVLSFVELGDGPEHDQVGRVELALFVEDSLGGAEVAGLLVVPRQPKRVATLVVGIDLRSRQGVDDLGCLLEGTLCLVDLGQPVHRLEVLRHQLEAAPERGLGAARVGHVHLIDVAEGEEDPAEVVAILAKARKADQRLRRATPVLVFQAELSQPPEGVDVLGIELQGRPERVPGAGAVTHRRLERSLGAPERTHHGRVAASSKAPVGQVGELVGVPIGFEQVPEALEEIVIGDVDLRRLQVGGFRLGSVASGLVGDAGGVEQGHPVRRRRGVGGGPAVGIGGGRVALGDRVLSSGGGR